MTNRPNSLQVNDLTSLTEFGVLTPEKPTTSSGFSLTKLFRKIISDGNSELTDEPESRSNSIEESQSVSKEDVKVLSAESSPLHKDVATEDDGLTNLDPHVAFSVRDPIYTRSLANVLKRVRNIVDRRSSTPQAYKDSDFKQYWMPDSNCKECYECGDKFNTFRRRHHCRVCGQIFCRRCCNQEIPGKIMGYTGDLRACTYCCKVVLSYIRSSDLLPTGDLLALQEDLNACLNDMDNQLESSNSIYESSNNSIRNSGSFRRKISTGFREKDFVSTSSRTDLRKFASVPDMQTASERKLLTKDSAQLRDLWAQMEHPVHGVDFQNHRYLLKTFQNCVFGCEMVDWLLAKDKVASRYQASAIGQALIDAGILMVIGRPDNTFVDDFVMYRASKNDIDDSSKDMNDFCDAGQEPSWVKDIIPNEDISEEDSDGSHEQVNLSGSSSPNDDNGCSIPRSYSTFYLNLNLQNSTASVKRAVPTREFKMDGAHNTRAPLLSSSDCFNSEHLHSILPPQSDASNTTISEDFIKDALFVNQSGNRVKDIYTAPQGWSPKLSLREENGERLAFERLQKAYSIHRKALIRQLLSSEGLSLNWQETILSIIKKVVEMVRPDVLNDNDDKDIRQYVHIKIIPGGFKNDCQIISGVVATKNILHRKMKAYLENPKILLVTSSIDYQRVENKLSSLEPIIMQEFEYLKNVVAKLCSYKPNIIMVEKTVSRCAQDMLLAEGITVVLNVKRSVIERVARCTQADIVSSLDAQLCAPRLGVCHRFWVHNYTTSRGQLVTLMGFEGCPKHLGCTVLLRGASDLELNKVKQIIQFLIYVEYNWGLERSFLMDEFALPPALPEETPLVLTDNESAVVDDNLFNDDSVTTPSDECLPRQIVRSTTTIARSQSESLDKPTTEKRTKRYDSGEDANSKMESMKKSERCSIEEHIDPLRSTIPVESKSSKLRKRSRMEVAPLPLSNRFRKALNDVVLSSSPNMKFSVPFLESEAGKICKLRKFFPEEIYWSAQLHKDSCHQNKLVMEPEALSMQFGGKYDGRLPDNIEIQPWHPFIFSKLTNPVHDASVQNLLASFRSNGGQIKRLCPHEVAKKKREKKGKNEDVNHSYVAGSTSVSSHSNFKNCWEKKVDALDLYKHQRLPVLFCSYSYTSNNAPNFCVNPWVVSMDFYGNNDITLGEFLERYCFRSTYECPSESCDTPMSEHIRKFAHEDGCIHIVLKKLDKPIPMAQSVILMWSWCYKCKQVTPFAPMSIDTWSLSFAKYLDLRFNGGIYGRRATPNTCGHVLHHDFYQYFAYKDTVASFKYTKISLLEVGIPSMVVGIEDYAAEPSLIINEVKTVTIKGYSIYSCVLEKLCTLRESCIGSAHQVKVQSMLQQLAVERNSLRERIGEIQGKLTSPSMDDKAFISDDCNTALGESSDVWCEIGDLTCYLKQMISEAVLNWNNRIKDFINLKRSEDKALRKQALISVSSQGSPSNSEVYTSISSTPNASQELESSNHGQENSDISGQEFQSANSSLSPEASTSFDPIDVVESDPKDTFLSSSSSQGNDEVDGDFASKPEEVPKESCVEQGYDEVDGSILRNRAIVAKKLPLELENEPQTVSTTFSPTISTTTSTREALNEGDVTLSTLDQMDGGEVPSDVDAGTINPEKAILMEEDEIVIQDASLSRQSSKSEGTDANLELAETSEECLKTIEALDRLQEEEIRRRFSSVETFRHNSSASSVSSITICETAGMYIGNINPDEHPSESFAILHQSQLKEIEEKEALKEARSHIRSKSDGDKSVSSQLSSSYNSEADGESPKIPQSSTTPVIKVPPSQLVDKERKVAGTMKNLISQFLSTPLSSPVQSPFQLTEHFLLNVPNNEEEQKTQRIPVIVYDDEPSSIISYTLSSNEYEIRLQELVDDLISAQQKDVSSSSPKGRRKNFTRDEDVFVGESPTSSVDFGSNSMRKITFPRNQAESARNMRRSTSDAYDHRVPYQYSKRDSTDVEEDIFMDINSGLTGSQEAADKSKVPNHHIEIQFSDPSANFYCKVYFAEQFRMLRRLIFPSGEERYIRSLARCRQWKVHGGKSGSMFCKTHDDRFILKQMSKLEVESFVVSAVNYFKYVHRAANEQRPTVLAKILGVYHIGYRNTQTNTASKLHLLVMENLFYGREIKRKFDLKGSERNRLVNTAGKEESELVLLDENLLKMTCDSPLYIKPHTKTVLTMAIQNDSEFLSSQLVMDYSLLVGLDEDRKELVVGIIDYIRKFTWDKKLEMIFKQAIGTQDKMPTVVKPKLYRTRFCEAMDRYFLMVPDRWNGFGKGFHL